jgi:hypothetical protein
VAGVGGGGGEPGTCLEAKSVGSVSMNTNLVESLAEAIVALPIED